MLVILNNDYIDYVDILAYIVLYNFNNIPHTNYFI